VGCSEQKPEATEGAISRWLHPVSDLGQIYHPGFPLLAIQCHRSQVKSKPVFVKICICISDCCEFRMPGVSTDRAVEFRQLHDQNEVPQPMVLLQAYVTHGG
jgi:hypothetical protein